MCTFSLMISLTRSYLLLITFQPMHVIGQGCPSKWFGPGCKYQCHCSGETACGPRGECNGPCQSKYFGPSCQYKDIFAWDAIHPTKPYLLDGLYSTCNPDARATNVQIVLKTLFTFTWYRLIVTDTSKIGTNVAFQTKINENQRCVNERVFIKDMKTVDVTCAMHFLVTTIVIEGNIAPTVCSIHIGGGRNVALKETTYQSSTQDFGPLGRLGPSHNAVDGNCNADFSGGSCTQTTNGIIGHRWQLTLSRPAIMYYVGVTNRNEMGYRMIGVILRLITEDNVPSFTYTFATNKAYYGILVYSTTAIKKVSMDKENDEPLTLCEVEIFGDTICPNNTFGFMCDGKCSCLDREHCNMITGLCAPMCQIGWYGANCSSRCSENCLFRECDFRSGSCLPCVPGYKGVRCDEECSPSTYGAGCKLNCSIGCADTCKSTSGTCVCNNNFIGSLCEDCLPGMFGSNCQFNCSSGCAGECDKISAHCACKEGYTGLLCSECLHDMTGSNCHVSCSKGCQYTCNNQNGYCTCRNGYTGLLCLECLPGVFGSDCEFNCSKGCADICNSTTGHCTCRYGYDGLMCTDCNPSNFGSDCQLTCPRGCDGDCNRTDFRCFACLQGWYGTFCEKDCSEFCFGKFCNMSNGDCFVCFGNRVGRLCQDCEHAYYGIRCESQCSQQCINRTCDHVSGKCPKCRKGFTGNMCLQGVEKPSPWVAPMTFVPFLLLLFLCLPGGNDDFGNDVADNENVGISSASSSASSYSIIWTRLKSNISDIDYI